MKKDKVYSSGQTLKLYYTIQKDNWREDGTLPYGCFHYLSLFENCLFEIGKNFRSLSEVYLCSLIHRAYPNTFHPIKEEKQKYDYEEDFTHIHHKLIKALFYDSIEDLLTSLHAPFLKSIVRWRIELGV